MTFQPYPTRSGLILLGLAATLGAIAILLISLLVDQSNLLSIFELVVGLLVILGLMGIVLYWTIIAFKLHYHLNRNGLAIQWGLSQQLIPFESIETIIPGKNLSTALRFRGLNIAGLWLGKGQLAEYGPTRFHTTTSLANSLLVVTPGLSYFISPCQPENFIRAWQARRKLGSTQPWPAGVQRSWPLTIPLLADPVSWWLLGPACLACLALFGYLAFILPELPASLPVHFNAFGRADRIADKSTLLMLPAAGALVLVANTMLGSLIYRREKIATYLLWGSAVAVQLALWVAVSTITAT